MATYNHKLDPKEVIITIIGVIATLSFFYKGVTIPSTEHMIFAILAGIGTYFYVCMAESFGSF